MKHAVPFQAALEAALQTYLSTAQPQLRHQALAEAQRHLINPSMLLEAPQLTARHPLRTEALILADAFEAVTNGMVTAEVMDPLQDIADDSLFASWKHVVLAVHFFYEGLDEATTAHLSRVPAGSPLAPLARALTNICRAEALSGRPLDPPTRSLFAHLHVTHAELSALAQQLTDALESSAENSFWAVLTDLLEECHVRHDLLARRIVLWVWTQLEWLEFDEANLLEISESLWGRAESSRLAALGSLAWDPEGAALLWGRFLVQGVREDLLSDEELSTALRLLGEFHECALEACDQALDPLWQSTWAALAAGWKSEVRLRGRTSGDFPGVTATLAPVTATMPSTPSSTALGQLDLFAS